MSVAFAGGNEYCKQKLSVDLSVLTLNPICLHIWLVRLLVQKNVEDGFPLRLQYLKPCSTLNFFSFLIKRFKVGC